MELSELMENIDPVEYIGQFVDLEQKNGEFWGLSPFKQEKTPSFSVRPETGLWYDFSAGCGGNLVEFVRRYKGVSVGKAIQELETYIGIAPEKRTRIRFEATKVAKKYKPRDTKRKQAIDRSLPDNYMEIYDADPAKRSLWASEGISEASMQKFQVRFDDVSQRIVYPIRNPDGKIVNVSGRTVDPDYQLKNLRKYTYFMHFGALETIYGLYENRESILLNKEIILFEGAKSVMLADSWGIPNTGAVLTSHLNQAQLKILAGLGVRAVFAFDKDADPYKDENIRKLRRFVQVEIVKDHNDLLQPKMSPVDAGLDTWMKLYMERRVWK